MYRHGPQRKHTYKQTVSCALLQFFDFRCAAKQQPTNQTRLQNRLLSSEYSLYFVCIVQGCSQSNACLLVFHRSSGPDRTPCRRTSVPVGSSLVCLLLLACHSSSFICLQAQSTQRAAEPPSHSAAALPSMLLQSSFPSFASHCCLLTEEITRQCTMLRTTAQVAKDVGNSISTLL